MDKRQKLEYMKALALKLQKAAYAYEQQNTEIMTNYEYDKLYDELYALEQELGVVLAGSVTQKVGYEVVSNLKKVGHSSKMLSLDKTKEISKLESFLKDQEGLLSWKLDGLTIVCTYEGGRLVQAVTRGNGAIGEDVTSNAKTFKNLPLYIPHKERLVVRGEAIITYSDFEAINEKLPEEERYKNPRNLCSGSVRQLNSKITASRNVRFYVFAVVEGKGDLEKKSNQLEWLKGQGFEAIDYAKVTSKNIEDTVYDFQKQIISNDFGSDGLVLTYDDLLYSKTLGATAKFPKDSIAFKWKDEIKETTIKEISWNTSRTGLINPIAIFEPVELEGTTVERASVHNLSVLEELKLGVGDIITVYKANMIIPQIAENISQTGPCEVPQNCPVCGEKTIVSQQKTAKALYCVNINCRAQKLKAFSHFVSRDAMNIEGLSEATLEKFMQNGFLEDLVSLYHLAEYEEEIKQLEGFGEKSYHKLMRSIEKSRQVALSNFVYSLGILQVGPMNARLISDFFEEDLEKIMGATIDTLVSINGIGPIIAREVVNYFSISSNKEMVEKLARELSFTRNEKESEMHVEIQGKVFVITGEVAFFENRKALQARIESMGGKVTGSVSKNTDYLINNDRESASSKNKKAKELNIPILKEEDFLKLIGQNIT
jgi:DNA ligase (NAD+)